MRSSLNQLDSKLLLNKSIDVKNNNGSEDPQALTNDQKSSSEKKKGLMANTVSD